MTLDAFIREYNGKVCTHPKGIAGQCVCLYRCYLDKVLGVPQSPGVRGAKDIWNTYLTNYFIRIPNTPLGIPKRGDIMIIDQFPGNPNGHVCIYLDGNVWYFHSFDSNWGTPKRARVETHYYLRQRVLGWLRRK